MKSDIHEKNIPVWIDRSIDFLNDFVSLYERRPIKYNKGGMLFTHMFYFMGINISTRGSYST